MAAGDEDVERAGYKVARFLGYDCLKPDESTVVRFRLSLRPTSIKENVPVVMFLLEQDFYASYIYAEQRNIIGRATTVNRSHV